MKNRQHAQLAYTGTGTKTGGIRFISRVHTIAALSILLPAIASAQVPDTLFTVRDNLQNTRMSLHTTGAFLLGGTFQGGSIPPVLAIPIEGPGTRLMWYPENAAFRAGSVNGTQWDEANIGYHSFAAGQNVQAYGTHATAFGLGCYAFATSSLAIGDQNVASGAASVALGYHSHTNARQGSFVFGDRSTVDTIRAGVNHSANWRVSGGFRIFTSSNLSTGITLQSGASVSNWGQSNAVISTSTGAMLSTGGVWQNASDVNKKHLFEAVSGEDILKRLCKLPIQRWSYRTENGIRHLGPTAQDFYAAFGLGGDERSIGTVDADGVALVSVQALEARTSQLAAQCADLKAENTELRHRLDMIERKSGTNFGGLSLLAIAGALGLGGLMLRRRTTGIKS